MELPPNDQNNNPHLRGQNARFVRGGENPRLYLEVPPVSTTFMDLPGGADRDDMRQRTHGLTHTARETGNWQATAREYAARTRDMHPTIDITSPGMHQATDWSRVMPF